MLAVEGGSLYTCGGHSFSRPQYWLCFQTLCNGDTIPFSTTALRHQWSRPQSECPGHRVVAMADEGKSSHQFLGTGDFAQVFLGQLEHPQDVESQEVGCRLGREDIRQLQESSAGHDREWKLVHENRTLHNGLALLPHRTAPQTWRHTGTHDSCTMLGMILVPLSTSIRAELASWRISLLTAPSLISCTTPRGVF